jgi:hypothetical protein
MNLPTFQGIHQPTPIFFTNKTSLAGDKSSMVA